ncbi:hypothetical protein ACLB2K_023252 [Fragaria x ananassa]
MADQVRLFGTWCSPFSARVIWALKLKGIPYDYTEEHLPYKKSDQLLKYNPVHKKIPVLVHGDKPICESIVIIEYIEETWRQNPLLPSDPYERAMARFWAPAIGWSFELPAGEEQEKAKKETLEMLRTIEEHAGGLDKKRFFGGDSIGIVDIAFGYIARWYGVIEEVVGVQLREPHAFPHVHAWTNVQLQRCACNQRKPS